MAVSSAPRILTYKADGAIAKGKAVKIGSDNKHVAVGAANTDKVIGICQNVSSVAEDLVEIAIQGGGAKGLLGENVVAGNLLVSHTDGSLVKANAAGDHLIAKALESGSSGDTIGVEVIYGQAAVAE